MSHGGAQVVVQPSMNLPRITPKPGQGEYPREAWWCSAPKLHLTLAQSAACSVAAGTLGALVGRPIYNLHHFYFMALQPHVMHFKTKRMYFVEAMKQAVRMRGPGNFWHTALWYSLLVFTPQLFFPLVTPVMPWPLNGFGAGFLAGGLLAAMRHPIDVLHATAESTQPSAGKRFVGPLDVLKRSMRENPRALLGLYSGFRYAGSASALQYAVVFGLFEALKGDVFDTHWWFLPFLSWLCVFGGHAVHFPAHNIKQQLVILNKGKMFGGVGPWEYIMEQRRKQGITVIYNGFFDSKPGISAWGPASALYLHDVTSRALWARYPA